MLVVGSTHVGPIFGLGEIELKGLLGLGKSSISCMPRKLGLKERWCSRENIVFALETWLESYCMGTKVKQRQNHNLDGFFLKCTLGSA